MATVTKAGIIPRDLEGFRTLMNNRFRDQFGQDLDVSGETPQGGIVGIWSLALAEEDEALVDVSNGFSLFTCSATQLADFGALLGIEQIEARKSTVTATILGTAGTIIPVHSRARTDANREFETTEAVTIPASGSIDVTMTSVDAGPILASPNSLTEISTPRPGWLGVDNTAAAVPGRLIEPIADYRSRMVRLTARNATSSKSALESALYEAGATLAAVHINEEAVSITRQGLTIPAKSILCIVRGGDDDDIARAILDYKGMGVGTSGAVSAAGESNVFQRADVEPIALTLTIDIDRTVFPADGVDRIKTALAKYVTDQRVIGQTVNSNRLLAMAYQILGHSIESSSITYSTSLPLPASPNLDVLYTLSAQDVTINITPY